MEKSWGLPSGPTLFGPTPHQSYTPLVLRINSTTAQQSYASSVLQPYSPTLHQSYRLVPIVLQPYSFTFHWSYRLVSIVLQLISPTSHQSYSSLILYAERQVYNLFNVNWNYFYLLLSPHGISDLKYILCVCT